MTAPAWTTPLPTQRRYDFPRPATGTYTIVAAHGGLPVETYKDVQLGQSQQVRLNFNTETGGRRHRLTSSLSHTASDYYLLGGGVLTEKEVQDLPIASRNIITWSLIRRYPGSGHVCLVDDELAGLQVNQVNTTRTACDQRRRYANALTRALSPAPT